MYRNGRYIIECGISRKPIGHRLWIWKLYISLNSCLNSTRLQTPDWDSKMHIITFCNFLFHCALGKKLAIFFCRNGRYIIECGISRKRIAYRLWIWNLYISPNSCLNSTRLQTPDWDSKMHIITSLQFLIPLRTREKARHFHVQKQPIYNWMRYF
jgi:hypothetical protein